MDADTNPQASMRRFFELQIPESMFSARATSTSRFLTSAETRVESLPVNIETQGQGQEGTAIRPEATCGGDIQVSTCESTASDGSEPPNEHIIETFESRLAQLKPQRQTLAQLYFQKYQDESDCSALQRSIFLDQWQLSDISLAPDISESVEIILESCAWKHVALWKLTNDVMDLERAVGYFRMLIRSPTGQEFLKTDQHRCKILEGLMRCYRNIYDALEQMEDLDRAIDAGGRCIELGAGSITDNDMVLWGLLECLIARNKKQPGEKTASQVAKNLYLFQPMRVKFVQLASRWKDPTDERCIPPSMLIEIAQILFTYYRLDPNNIKGPRLPYSGDVLNLAIDFQRYGLDSQAPCSPEDRIWWKIQLSSMLTQRHLRNRTEDSEKDCQEALSIASTIDKYGCSDWPPAKLAVVQTVTSEQLALLFDPQDPNMVETHLNSAILMQGAAVSAVRDLIRTGALATAEKPTGITIDLTKWVVQLEQYLLQKLHYHLEQGDDTGFAWVEEQAKNQIYEAFMLNEEIPEGERLTGKAQALLTRAWLTYYKFRYDAKPQKTDFLPPGLEDEGDDMDGTEDAQAARDDVKGGENEDLIQTTFEDGHNTAGTQILKEQITDIPPDSPKPGPDDTAQEVANKLLNKAIQQGLDALAVATDSQHSEGSIVPLNIRSALSVFYLARYDCAGDMDDLATGARYARKCVKSLSKNKRDSIDALHHYLRACHAYAAILVQRFRARGAYRDLEDAIYYETIAKDGSHADRLLRAKYELTLAQYLELQFSTLQDASMGDKETEKRAKQSIAGALEHCWSCFNVLDKLGGRQVKVAIRDTLSRIYHEHYAIGGETRRLEMKGFLDKAIELAEGGLEVAPFGGPERVSILSTLSSAYALSPEKGDLEKAVKYAKMAVNACPKEHFQITELNYQLGEVLSMLHENQLDSKVNIVIQPLKACLDKEDAPPSYRLKATVLAADLLQKVKDWKSLYEFTKKAMNLMPLLCIKTLSQRDQQTALKSISGLGCIAAAAALMQPEVSNDEALTLLEQGRDVIASNRYDTRADITALRNGFPKYAEKFDVIREQLDPAGVGVRMNLRADSRYAGFGQSENKVRDITTNVLQANEKYRRLLKEIRGLEGFENFLRGPDAEMLKRAATGGTIIVVNVAPWRCDAFIIRNGEEIKLCPLENLKEVDVDNRLQEGRNNKAPIDLMNNKALNWIWDVIAEPLFKELGYINDFSPNDPVQFSMGPPRIWWVLTRNTCRLPIHAGMNNPSPESGVPFTRVINRVVSSYITSIKALIFARQQLEMGKKSTTSRVRCSLLCAVQETSMDTVEDLRTLRTAKREILGINGFLNKPKGPMKGTVWAEKPQAKAVLSALSPLIYPTPTVFHFAGHGISDPFDPSNSRIYLYDEKLTVDDLLRARVFKAAPILAYLSACSTGTASRIPDESVHIMSGFASAGFMNVVGTLWDTDDEVSRVIAMHMYRRWVELDCNPEQLARCLHYAVEFTKQDNRNPRASGSAMEADNWACFVHMGV